jgi:hypothetical protein
MAHTPARWGPAGGKWTIAAYLGERANEQQRIALQAIVSGAGGGSVGPLAPLIGTMVGVQFAPVSFGKDGRHRSLAIPDIAHLAIRALPGLMPDQEIVASTPALSTGQARRLPLASGPARGTTTACMGTTLARARTLCRLTRRMRRSPSLLGGARVANTLLLRQGRIVARALSIRDSAMAGAMHAPTGLRMGMGAVLFPAIWVAMMGVMMLPAAPAS